MTGFPVFHLLHALQHIIPYRFEKERISDYVQARSVLHLKMKRLVRPLHPAEVGLTITIDGVATDCSSNNDLYGLALLSVGAAHSNAGAAAIFLFHAHFLLLSCDCSFPFPSFVRLRLERIAPAKRRNLFSSQSFCLHNRRGKPTRTTLSIQNKVWILKKSKSILYF